VRFWWARKAETALPIRNKTLAEQAL